MSPLADPFEGLLRQSGWAPGRSVSTEEARQKAADEGFPWWPELEAMLAEYSGLEVHFRSTDDRDDVVRIDPIQGMDWIYVEDLDRYREILGADIELFPIGVTGFQHQTILAGRDGQFFGVYDHYVEYLGASAREMIRRAVDRSAHTPE